MDADTWKSIIYSLKSEQSYPTYFSYMVFLILFKNQIQTTSASPCRTWVQPSASFLVCSLIFIEYQLTLVVQNYWQFSSQIGNFFWIRNLISLVFIGLMIWILAKAGHGYLFVIPKKKWLLYTVLTVFVTVLYISFNFQTARHVQSTSEGWAVLIGYSETNFAELGIYLTLFFLGPLMEELIYRGLFQHAFFKDSKLGLDLILPSVLFALPHFSSFPNFLDILVFSTFGVCCAGLTRYTKSIYPGYAVHVINNIVATLPFLLTFLHRIFSWNKIWKWSCFQFSVK